MSFAGALFTFSCVCLLRRPIETRQKKPQLFWFDFVLFFLGFTGITVWGLSTRNYPNCNVPYASWIGNGFCNGEPYISEARGYDGGDCVDFLADYPGCYVINPFWIADGTCDSGAYNTMECGHDGGDCVLENHENYPDCIVPNPSWIGNGKCDGRVYGTVECGFDGGDCLEPGKRCHGNGDCVSEVCNSVITKVCDSAFASDLYPNCSVDKPEWIGNGECDGGDYTMQVRHVALMEETVSKLERHARKMKCVLLDYAMQTQRCATRVFLKAIPTALWTSLGGLGMESVTVESMLRKSVATMVVTARNLFPLEHHLHYIAALAILLSLNHFL